MFLQYMYSLRTFFELAMDQLFSGTRTHTCDIFTGLSQKMQLGGTWSNAKTQVSKELRGTCVPMRVVLCEQVYGWCMYVCMYVNA